MNQFSIKLEQFEGPLQLLSSLVDKEELDISEISLAKVADQFLYYLEHFQISSQELADFLLVAARLLLIKSRLLRPEVYQEEETDNLVYDLEIYRLYHQAAKTIRKIHLKGNYAFSREKFYLPSINKYSFNYKIKLSGLQKIFKNVVKSYVNFLSLNLPTKKLKKIVTLTEKIQLILNLIKNKTIIDFKKIIQGKSKEEIIVTFLASLELVKQKALRLSQSRLFSHIVIKKI